MTTTELINPTPADDVPHEVVVQAGVYRPLGGPRGAEFNWLFLVCKTEGCRWDRGYAEEYDPAKLAEAAEAHALTGEQWKRDRDALMARNGYGPGGA